MMCGVAALLLSACSMNEEVYDGGTATTRENVVTFKAYANRARTRAAQTDVTTDNLTKFNVSARGTTGVYFKDVTFTKGTTEWESTPEWYWPAFNLEFLAYNVPNSKYTISIPFTAGSGDATMTVTVPTDVKNQEDLVAAHVASKSAPASGDSEEATSITFKHITTQIIVKATNQNDNYQVKVKGVKLANLFGKGICTFASSDCTMAPTASSDTDYKENCKNASGDAILTLSSGDAQELLPVSNASGDAGRWYLIPQTDLVRWSASGDAAKETGKAYLAILVQIKSKVDGKYTCAVYPKDQASDDYAYTAVELPESLKFEQGHKYTITVNFFKNGGAGKSDPEEGEEPKGDEPIKSDKPIKFSATVNEWTAETGINIDL